MKVDTGHPIKIGECSNPDCKGARSWLYSFEIGGLAFRLCRPCGRRLRSLWWDARPESQEKKMLLRGVT